MTTDRGQATLEALMGYTNILEQLLSSETFTQMADAMGIDRAPLKQQWEAALVVSAVASRILGTFEGHPEHPDYANRYKMVMEMLEGAGWTYERITAETAPLQEVKDKIDLLDRQQGAAPHQG